MHPVKCSADPPSHNQVPLLLQPMQFVPAVFLAEITSLCWCNGQCSVMISTIIHLQFREGKLSVFCLKQQIQISLSHPLTRLYKPSNKRHNLSIDYLIYTTSNTIFNFTISSIWAIYELKPRKGSNSQLKTIQSNEANI